MSVRLLASPPSPLVTRPRGRFLVVLWVVSALIATLPAVASANPEESRIAQTRADLESVRAELEDARDEAEDHQIDLEEADRQLQAAFDAVEAAAQAVGRQEDAVADAEQRLVTAREDLQVQRERMADRIARLYRQARPEPMLSILDATTVTDAVRQSAYMSAIGREDRAAVEGLTNAETTVAAEEQALAAEQVSLGRILEEQQVVLEQVEEIREDKALVAAASEDLVARLQARENHLESEAAELAALAQRREADAAAAAAVAAAAAANRQVPTGATATTAATASTASTAATASTAGSDDSSSGQNSGSAAPAPAPPPPPAPSGGGFSWPTSGTVTSEFGERWGRMHEGIDIANGSGTPVAAARGGTVIHAGTMGGYGNLVLIAHSGGFVTAYAHLSSIAVSNGQSVSTGTFLGGMGCSGSCTGTHLHFEIRANGQAVNPRSYL
ncbi:hypothetical protein BH23ACT9_BH23ACT9_14290 [soil metagenome]